MKGKRKKPTDNYTTEFKAELDRRYAEYKSGNAEVFTAEESKRRINKILKAKRE